MTSFSFWKGKRVLITGHTGFKGAWLCKILELAGANVIGYALSPESKENLFDLCAPRVTSIIGDIRDFDLLFETYKRSTPEIVIHLAAQALVLDSYQMPRHTFDTNIMGTVNLLECLRQLGGAKSFLNVTTDKVYMNRESTKGYGEEDKLNGHDPYSNSKSCSELVTSSYDKSFLRQMNMAVSTARSGNVIGGGDFSSNRLIPDCAKAVSCGQTIKIRNPKSIRPYQHVLDTLFAYLMIAQRQYENPSLSSAYNIGPEEKDHKSSEELVTMFCKTWGSGYHWEHVFARNPPESAVLRLDCTKIKKTMGWQTRWNIHKAVEETVLWYKTYYQNGNINAIMQRQIMEFIQ